MIPIETNEETRVQSELSRLSSGSRTALLWALYNGGFTMSTEADWTPNLARTIHTITHNGQRYLFELTAWGRKLAYEHLKTLPIERPKRR
jgi:hypothetical protein